MPDRLDIVNRLFREWNDAADSAARGPDCAEEALSDLAVAVLVVGAEVCYHLENIAEGLRR